MSRLGWFESQKSLLAKRELRTRIHRMLVGMVTELWAPNGSFYAMIEGERKPMGLELRLERYASAMRALADFSNAL